MVFGKDADEAAASRLAVRVGYDSAINNTAYFPAPTASQYFHQGKFAPSRQEVGRAQRFGTYQLDDKIASIFDKYLPNSRRPGEFSNRLETTNKPPIYNLESCCANAYRA